MKLWRHQEAGLAELWRQIDGKESQRICVTSPTGAGKTVMQTELAKAAVHKGMKVSLYTNRVMLTEQTSSVLASQGLRHGIRASGFNPALMRDIQISSLMTENSRVFNSGRWTLHDADLVIVDEAHSQKAAIAQKVLNEHTKHGAVIVGWTATPLGINHVYDSLIVAGSNSEARQCGAHVPCDTFGPDEPNMKDCQVNGEGDYSEGDISKRVMVSTIFGRVVRHWKRLNPDGKPTVLFAPGVSESKWFVDQFERAGVTAAHIDGKNIYWHGQDQPSTPEFRKELMRASKDGDVQVVCNRFVLREAIDMPWLAHGIGATVFGSLQTFLQAGGRLLRNHDSLDRVMWQCHGGSGWRHGSLNEDRKWDLSDTSKSATKKRKDDFKDGVKKEPVCCPECGAVRRRGGACPYCGYKHKVSVRFVVELDGSLKKMKGQVTPRRKLRSAEQKQWDSCFFRCLNSRRQITMNQVAAMYQKQHGSYPPAELSYVPKNGTSEWEMPVKSFHKHWKNRKRKKPCGTTIG